MDEDPISHLCAFFPAYDPNTKKVFIGRHIRSGIWLFNGGHVDKGETLTEALEREINEEWGPQIRIRKIEEPSLLTITAIQKKMKNRACKTHYDIWSFVEVNERTFNPEEKKLKEEFYETRWLNPDEAKKRITDPNTRKALEVLEKRF